MDYEKTVKKIFDFLDVDSSIHKEKNKYLKPEESKKNIGIWKSFKQQDLIRRIETELADYCWDLRNHK